MLLAVAGLSKDDVKKRTKNLSDDNWSAFPPAERLAFQFAHKQTKKPADITSADVDSLVKTFGPHRALDLIWYGSWCNYMTRVADAFQIPLETQNVFQRPSRKKKKKQSEKKSGSKKRKPTKKR